MKTREITIIGKKLKIRFSMLCQIMYEQLSGTSFSDFDASRSKDRMFLYLSVISANNDGETVTADELLNECTLDDIRILDAAVSESMSEWSKIPDVVSSMPSGSLEKKS